MRKELPFFKKEVVRMNGGAGGKHCDYVNITGYVATDSILTSMLCVFYGNFKKVFLKEEDHV